MLVDVNGAAVRLPDFFVIGAAKSGTTSLFNYLAQHPGVYFSQQSKEPGYFCFADRQIQIPSNGLPNLWETAIIQFDRYVKLFSQAPEQSLIGEATPEYLLLPEETISVLGRLYRERASDLKFIALLRNPTERIWSHYWMMRRDGFENLDFERAICSDTISSRLNSGWHPAYDYLGYGLYGEQIAAYFERFGSRQLKLILFEDFRADPGGVCQDIFAFLGLDTTIRPDVSTKHNVSGALRHPLLHRWLFTREHSLKSLARHLLPQTRLQSLKARLVAWNSLPVNMPLDERLRLSDYYREDILRLSRLTGLDLSHWLGGQ